MDLIKHYTLFANGKLFRHQLQNGEWRSFYGIDNLRLINNNTKKEATFIREEDKKLMKSLAEIGYSKKANKSRYDSIARRLRYFYGQTETKKKDWVHIVDNTGGILKIWLTNIHYDKSVKRAYGEIVLFKENGIKNIELIKYETQLNERRGTVGGRYHDFSKAFNYTSLTHHLEMERKEMRKNTYVAKLRDNATLKENTEHNNDIVEAHNGLTDTLNKQQLVIEQLQLEIMKLKKTA